MAIFRHIQTAFWKDPKIIEDMNILHNLINYLSSIYVNYINNKISKSKAKKEINEVMDKIVHYKNILLSLEKVLEKAVENNYYIA